MDQKGSPQHPHLGNILVLVPFGDDEQLGQGLWVVVTDVKSHLPHQILLVLVELRVAPALQDLLQLQLLLTAKSTHRAQPAPTGLAQLRDTLQDWGTTH